ISLSSGASRTQIAGAITSSTEYQADRIQETYTKYLNRGATPSEVTFYTNLLQNGATGDDLRAPMLGSDEYYRLAGGTNPGFLNKLFQDVLGRLIDASSAAAFGAVLSQGTPRQTI